MLKSWSPSYLRRNVFSSSGVPVSTSSFWQDVRDAIRGEEHHDFTEGPLGRAIILLAVPMVMEMIMESVFAVVDVFYVSRLGPEAVATVGLTESMLTLIYTLAMGLGIGVMATVARRVGEKNPEAASVAAFQGIALGIGFAVVIGVSGALFAPDLLRLMGASPEVLASGTGYTRIMLGGNVVILMLFLVNAIFRGSGDAAIAMRVLWLANGLNIILAPCFIFGLGPFPRLGVMGAAVGTTMGRGLGVLYQFWCLTRPQRRVGVHRRHLTVQPKAMLALLRLSGQGTFQIFVGTASWIGAVRIVSSFGSAAVAGYTIGFRIIIFALLPSWGLSNAAATMVGQNLGAGKPERAERAVWMAGFYNMIFLGTIGLIFLFGCPGNRRSLHQRPGGRPDGGGLPADRESRVRVLCLGDGPDPVIQRRRRYLDSHPDQPGLLLDAGDTARLVSRRTHQPAGQRGVCRNRDRFLHRGGGQCHPVPARDLEDQDGVTRYVRNIRIALSRPGRYPAQHDTEPRGAVR